MSEAEATWLTTLYESADTALLGVDLDGRTVVWSQGAQVLFGWEAHEVLGFPPPIVPPSLRQEWQLQMRHVLDSNLRSPAAETERVTRDGRSITVIRTSTPARGPDGQVVGLLDVLIDATALKQLDEE